MSYQEVVEQNAIYAQAIMALERQLTRVIEEQLTRVIEELQREKREHDNCTTFHAIAVKERDYERVVNERLRTELTEARAALEAYALHQNPGYTIDSIIGIYAARGGPYPLMAKTLKAAQEGG
jgi:hypothetical protein